MAYKDVFARYECKYILDERQYAAFMKVLGTVAHADEYGPSTVCSVYYDTEDYRLIRASVEKPAYKEKLRLRSYGVASADSTVFVELKKKCRGVVFKRRIPMTAEQARRYINGDKDMLLLTV